MGRQTIILGQDAELIIDAPASVSDSSQSLVVAKAICQEFGGVTSLSPSTRTGSLSLRVGSSVYRVYYEFRVKRIMSALTAYSEAIRHIENNRYRYDQGLAEVAIETLRKCHRDVLR